MVINAPQWAVSPHPVSGQISGHAVLCPVGFAPLCPRYSYDKPLWQHSLYKCIDNQREKGENMIYLKSAKITTVVKNYERALSQIKQERNLIQHSHGYDA